MLSLISAHGRGSRGEFLLQSQQLLALRCKTPDPHECQPHAQLTSARVDVCPPRVTVTRECERALAAPDMSGTCFPLGMRPFPARSGSLGLRVHPKPSCWGSGWV